MNTAEIIDKLKIKVEEIEKMISKIRARKAKEESAMPKTALSVIYKNPYMHDISGRVNVLGGVIVTLDRMKRYLETGILDLEHGVTPEYVLSDLICILTDAIYGEIDNVRDKGKHCMAHRALTTEEAEAIFFVTGATTYVTDIYKTIIPKYEKDRR